MALVAGLKRFCPLGHEMGTGAEPRPRLDWLEPDQHRAVGVDEPLAVTQRMADMRLLARLHPAEAEIGGCGAAVKLGAGDVPLFDPHRAHGLEAVSDHAHALALPHQPLVELGGKAGRDINLEGALAQKTDPGDAADDVADPALGHRHEREGRIVERRLLHHALQELARARPGHRDARPLLADRGVGDVEHGPEILVV